MSHDHAHPAVHGAVRPITGGLGAGEAGVSGGGGGGSGGRHSCVQKKLEITLCLKCVSTKCDNCIKEKMHFSI